MQPWQKSGKSNLYIRVSDTKRCNRSRLISTTSSFYKDNPPEPLKSKLLKLYQNSYAKEIVQCLLHFANFTGKKKSF